MRPVEPAVAPHPGIVNRIMVFFHVVTPSMMPHRAPSDACNMTTRSDAKRGDMILCGYPVHHRRLPPAGKSWQGDPTSRTHRCFGPSR